MRTRPLHALLCLALGACGPATAEFVRRPSASIAWPAAPATPRVEVEYAYHDGDDVELHGGFLRGLARVVFGREERALVAPYGLTVTDDGRLLVADTALCAVHELDLESGAHRLLAGGADEPLRTPVGVACDAEGRVYVSDSSAGVIRVFDRAGEPLRTLGTPAILGRPTGLAFDAARGRLLIADTTGCRLLAYDLARDAFEAHGARGTAAGEFNYPTNLALDRAGRIYVTDSLNFRVQILAADFTPLGAFGQAGSGPGCFAKPKGIALDSQGHVYVVDATFDNVQVFDAEGRLLLAFAGPGAELGELTLPTGLWIDAQDRVYVADAGNARVQVFRFLASP